MTVDWTLAMLVEMCDYTKQLVFATNGVKGEHQQCLCV